MRPSGVKLTPVGVPAQPQPACTRMGVAWVSAPATSITGSPPSPGLGDVRRGAIRRDGHAPRTVADGDRVAHRILHRILDDDRHTVLSSEFTTKMVLLSGVMAMLCGPSPTVTDMKMASVVVSITET